MSTSVLIADPEVRPADGRRRAPWSAWTFSCAVIACLLLGYHPWAEDGGIYSSAIALRLHPELFPAWRAFAVAHTDRTLFAPLVAFLLHFTRLPLPVGLLLCHVAAVSAAIAAAGALARQLFSSESAQRWGVLLFAVALGVPVAGTSLYLADPYLTARSISTPLVLFATALLLQRRYRAALLCMVISAAVHPMMTVWAAVLLLTLLAWRSSRPVLLSIAWAAVLVVGMAMIAQLGAVDASEARMAAVSRAYWFPAQWAWYEWIGVAAPLAFLAVVARRGLPQLSTEGRDLAAGAAIATAVVSAASLLLVHMGSPSMLLARVQPLRLLHTTYLVFVLLLGGCLARARRGTGWLVLAAAAASLLFMQRSIYGDSLHLELPGRDPRNGYERAFLWARANTPADALFALDADYTSNGDSDAQMFRPLAWRSALPDSAKDGGIASVLPSLAPAWFRASVAQTGLATATDTVRLQRLQPFSVTWIVLPASSATAFECPYRNDVARVCRLPR